MLIGTSDSRMVLTIVETDSTVKLRVMMIAPVGIQSSSLPITYDSDVLTLSDSTYIRDIHYYAYGPLIAYYNLTFSPLCNALYKSKAVPYCEEVADLSVGPHKKYFKTLLWTTYVGPVTPSEYIVRNQAGELFPTYNMFFKKKNRGTPVKKEDFGFFADAKFGFDVRADWGNIAYTITNFRLFNPAANKIELRPDLFVYRSPSDVVTNPVSNITQTSATLNAQLKRGNIPPANDVYFTHRDSYEQTGRMNWDTICAYGFIYATSNVKISVNDVSKKITVGTVEYEFPDAKTIALEGATGISFGSTILYFTETANTSDSQYLNFSADITDLNTLENDYFAWSYIKYAFETSDTYLLIGNPISFGKIMDCYAMTDQYVQEDLPANSGTYFHDGNSWDPVVKTGITLSSATFYATGASHGTGTTLDGFTFNMGITTVKWVATDEQGVSDSCSFDVYVLPTQLLNCETFGGDKMVNETYLAGYYTHTNTDWDASSASLRPLPEWISSAVHFSYKSFSHTGILLSSGTTLNGKTFSVGTTLVRWYAKIEGGSTMNITDSCEFKVIVDPIPISVLDCSELHDQLIYSNSEDFYFYTHQGDSWDPKPGDIVLTHLTELSYKLEGATTGTGDWTLDGAIFNVGKTIVTWTGTDQYGFVGSCKFTVNVNITCPTSVAYEGGPYHVTPLAGLCWTDNMANRNYANGEPIAFAKAYYCKSCTDSTLNASIFGLLYTWHSAVNLPEGSPELPVPRVQGICPNGWHLPSIAELELLKSYPVEDLKSTEYWINPGTNLTGFNSLPAGFYNSAITRFEDLYGSTGYWAFDSQSNTTAHYFSITYYCDEGKTFQTKKSDGLSVRCVMNY